MLLVVGEHGLNQRFRLHFEVGEPISTPRERCLAAVHAKPFYTRKLV
jgi:hypothetical protein